MRKDPEVLIWYYIDAFDEYGNLEATSKKRWKSRWKKMHSWGYSSCITLSLID